jgi:hypothetical protein
MLDPYHARAAVSTLRARSSPLCYLPLDRQEEGNMHEPHEATTTRSLTRTAVTLTVLAAILLASCAAIRREEAQSTENLLAAAGFKARPADTPDKVAQLKSLPPLKMQMRQKDGKLVYTYADPDNCNCLYVGGPQQYAEYRRLALQKQIAEDQVAAAEAEEDAALDWGMWGPWGWY